ncbi:unnamed protein product [Acanthoscelides obtectus]|uniref:Methylenetetrahydrofolate reductase (NAD(P)H) n=1 Tax=Acanthoscelides obtectus TaxID=200917 RepID=A0A9P0L637_ACAOB|nr:unnamed protein product [Acanthoscelides obtectus]CAK1661139.1 Methylenetetrahydrofolate reductase [Acanthoscelides obtectus]
MDIQYLKHKVECGADFIITQASYSFNSYKNFVKISRSSGIHVPIIPGMFIIKSHRSLLAISEFCAVPIPPDILRVVSNIKGNNESILNFGMDFAIELTRKFLSRRDLFENVHYFCLNDLSIVERVIKILGIYDNYMERPIVNLENKFIKYFKEENRIQ